MSQRQSHDTLHRESDFDLASLLPPLCAWHAEHGHDTDDASRSPRAIRERMQAEVQALESLMNGDEDRLRLSDLARWLDENITRLDPLLRSRNALLLPESWARAHPRSRFLDEGRALMANAIDRDLEGFGAEGLSTRPPTWHRCWWGWKFVTRPGLPIRPWMATCAFPATTR
ncbi:hypothetical protein A8U91_04349 [Halomonas elongata]|uniref:Uncharacterized protein n=1 Tax=Halomonas elongata TaxID=2746 RepID=A0A1B8NZ20_HALEL|nr:hypothetical protein [Halomonas elongata]OBX35277.1 hypothetical protein A8U91_04349 [Halomonas elongata]